MKFVASIYPGWDAKYAQELAGGVSTCGLKTCAVSPPASM
jgi:hypothetical protein